MPTPRMDTLDRSACLQLMAAARLGRVAFVPAQSQGSTTSPTATIELIPIACALDGEDLVLRTVRGSRLAGAAGHSVSVEIDDVRESERSGWSIVASGLMTIDTEPGLLERLGDRLASWAPGERDLALRVRTERLSGRRLDHTQDREGPAIDLRSNNPLREATDVRSSVGASVAAWPTHRLGESAATSAETPFDGF